MEDSDKTSLPTYLVGFPTEVQQTVRDIVERENEFYKRTSESYIRRGMRPLESEENHTAYVNAAIKILKREILEKGTKNLNPKARDLADALIALHEARPI